MSEKIRSFEGCYPILYAKSQADKVEEAMSDTPRYYTDPSTPGMIYDEQSGMPAVIVQPDAGKWTDERVAMVETVLKAVNGGEG